MFEQIYVIPILLGLMAFILPKSVGRYLMVLSGIFHLGIVVDTFFIESPPTSGFFRITPESQLVLLVTSFLFLVITFYTLSYLNHEEMLNESLFSGCMLLFLGTMSMAALADHIIVFWIAIEATTLVSAPLIFFNKSKEALEATWKYIMICSVGIALALLGAFFMILAMGQGGENIPLTFTELIKFAPAMNPVWLKGGFIFLLIGFGTKMGLAPMHTWLPDAHSEAPSPASALLSGALLNCAFLGVFKAHAMMHAAGLGVFSGNLLVVFGLISMLVAAVFIIQQSDYKRLLAYSSIENMGIIAIGIGIGGLAAFGAMLHLIHHALLKSGLFLSSGNILLGYGTKKIKDTGNMARLMPRTFVAFTGGFAGISGFPPFGLFLSELLIILGAFQQGAYPVAALFILCLILIFAGASRSVIRMSFGSWEGELQVGEKLIRVVPSYILLAASIALCVYIPDRLQELIQNAVAIIGGGIHG